jgi:tetratricopeptide (TPR) repeat protein
MELCEQLLEEDPENVKALYFKGVGHENLAGEAVAISKKRGAAFNHGRTAKGLHERVLELDPEFVDAQLSIAVYEFAKATLPWSIKWIAFLLGMRGNKEEALEKLQEVVEKGKYRNLDAEVVMALLHSWKGDPQQSIRIFESLARKFPSNYLIDINMAAVYDIVLKDPQSSLRVYQKLADDLDKKAPGLFPGEVYYRIGKTQFTLNDYTPALESFKKAKEMPQGEQETSPLSSYYMGQIHQQRGETAKALAHYQRVLEYKGPQEPIKAELKEAKKRIKKLSK